MGFLIGILTTKTIKTEDLETNTLTINDDVKEVNNEGDEVDASAAGYSVIADGDTYVHIVTSVITVDSKIFVTARGESAVETALIVTEVIDGQCTVSMPEIKSDDIAFDWFVIN